MIDSKRIKQFFCLHRKTKEVIEDSVDHIILESSIRCIHCEKIVGYWVTGHWDPEYSSPWIMKIYNLKDQLKYLFRKRDPKRNYPDDELPF